MICIVIIAHIVLFIQRAACLGSKDVCSGWCQQNLGRVPLIIVLLCDSIRWLGYGDEYYEDDYEEDYGWEDSGGYGSAGRYGRGRGIRVRVSMSFLHLLCSSSSVLACQF